jgi:hypothetical protein
MTQRELAKLAGVSAGTVSNVISLEKRTFRPSLLPLDLKPIIIPTPNQVKLMRTHHPVTILHVGAVEFVCHILER